jgi:probable lipoprotein NlpC
VRQCDTENPSSSIFYYTLLHCVIIVWRQWQNLIQNKKIAENQKEMSILHGSRYSIFLTFLAALVLCTWRLHAAVPLENCIAFAPAEARSRVLAAAETYVNTPYRHGGLDRRGLDCSGLVYVSFKDALEVSVPRSATDLYSWVEKIQIENIRPGDLVFFKTSNNGSISHVGIFVGDKRFIHAASSGPKTGVIYSNLDERYWSLTYAGAGRALPEADISGGIGNKEAVDNKNVIAVKTKEQKIGRGKESTKEGKILIGFAAAPTWGTFLTYNNVVRGVEGQFRFGLAAKPLGQPMIFGMEVRHEWDSALGVFRMPITLSCGINDKLRVFVGPAFSFGDATLTVSGEDRHYTGGTNWFGTAGISIAPFAIKIAGNDLAPYAELAWQSYINNSKDKNFGADLAASYRFSTGMRYTWKIR